MLALQQRLSALGYWLGTPDGTFGDSTEQAVWALQKAAGINRSGNVDPATQAALAEGVLPQPRSTSGYVIEIDLQDDLLMVVTNGKIDYVLNTSTGGGYTYTEDGVTSVADTPTGQFQIYRQVNGLVVDSLGSLWRPKFFDAGFAIHGDTSVPPYPGLPWLCRVSNEAIDWVWAANLSPIGTVGLAVLIQVGAAPDPEVLFAGVATASLETAKPWYEALLGRPADIVANEDEVMWRICDGGWLYLSSRPAPRRTHVGDSRRARPRPGPFRHRRPWPGRAPDRDHRGGGAQGSVRRPRGQYRRPHRGSRRRVCYRLNAVTMLLAVAASPSWGRLSSCSVVRRSE